jgi:hypothetical protein
VWKKDGTFISICSHINVDIISGYFKCLGETVAPIISFVKHRYIKLVYARYKRPGTK